MSTRERQGSRPHSHTLAASSTAARIPVRPGSQVLIALEQARQHQEKPGSVGGDDAVWTELLGPQPRERARKTRHGFSKETRACLRREVGGRASLYHLKLELFI